jgi:hypothetical protein
MMTGALAGLLFADTAAAQYDPGTFGSHPVTVAEYGSFSTSISLGQVSNTEMLAQVQYPTDLANGPYPLVVLLHGRHPSCYTLSTGAGLYAWPCNSSTQAPVPSYQGYDYLASLLASWGMVVVSISADGINAVDNGLSDLGMDERGQLIQFHLDKWNTFNTVGGTPFGNTFVGHVDLQRVGTMGHSRGGEGVIWNFERNASLGSPYNIRAVLPVAPVDFFGHVINNVPVGVLLGYCDGDVYTLPGVAYVDGARYNVAGDNTPKYTFLALGANHNFFNRIWTPDQFAQASSDDWSGHDSGQTDPFCGVNAAGNGRLTSAQQRAVGAAYMASFFRKHLQGVIDFDGYLDGDLPPPPSASTNAVFNGYLPGASERNDLNRLLTSSELTTNTLGGAAISNGFAESFECGAGPGIHCVSGGRDPHFPSLTALELGWTAFGADYSNQLPPATRDLRDYGFIQFRVAVDYSDQNRPVALPQNFSVRIASAPASPSVVVGDFARTLYFPPGGNGNQADVMNTVRIPLSAFAGLDKTGVMSVDFVFDQVGAGTVLVSDISFSRRLAAAGDVWLAATSAL